MLQHTDFHAAPPCNIEVFETVVRTVRDQDGRIRLGSPPAFRLPSHGGMLEKEETRVSFDGTKFKEKVWQMVHQGGPSARKAVAAAQYVVPRKILMQLLRWVVLDREFAERNWYNKMKSIVCMAPRVRVDFTGKGWFRDLLGGLCCSASDRELESLGGLQPSLRAPRCAGQDR